MEKAVKFGLWLITLALAFLATHLFEAVTLAQAFFGIHTIISVVLLVVVLVISAVGDDKLLNTLGQKLNRVASRFILAFIITAFLSAVATLLVTVEFCVAYLLLSFSQSISIIDYVKGIEFNLKGKLAKFNKEKFMFWKKRKLANETEELAYEYAANPMPGFNGELVEAEDVDETPDNI